jgi:hypothetical protein
MRVVSSVIAITISCAALSCGGAVSSGPPSAPSTPSNVATPSGPPGTLVGAGDIALCGSNGAGATAKLLDDIRGTVFVSGDVAYPSGSSADFRDCFDPTWGRHRSRIRPVPGNHEYETPGASGYYEYFGANAGPSGLGYYSHTVGPWLVIAVNSELPSTVGSAQYEWIRAELTRDSRLCTAVIWHRPLFSSGINGPNADMRDLWRLLYARDVDIVINGHDHIYERFAPQTPDGQYDAERGIRQFTVGTGGAPSTPVGASSNSEVAASVWGVTSFTLQSDSYRWEFVPVEGESFRDSGIGRCH